MILETFTRVFVDEDKIAETINFYAEILSGQLTLRFPYPETGLEIAAVSSEKMSVLIIAGPAEKRAPFEQTRLTIKVENLNTYIEKLYKTSCSQLEPLQKTPVGHKTRFQHPDGTIVEYVDHQA